MSDFLDGIENALNSVSAPSTQPAFDISKWFKLPTIDLSESH